MTKFKIATIALLLSFVPSLIFAANCERFKEMETNGALQRIQNAFGARKEKMTEQRIEHDSELLNRRNKWIETKESFFDKMLEKAETDEQKQAVEELRDSLSQAVTVRDNKINIAREQFREAADKILDERETAIAAALNRYGKEHGDLFGQAYQNCQDGKMKQFRSEFTEKLSEIKRIHSQLREDINSEDKESLQLAKGEFLETTKEAKDEFKKTAEEIRNKFKEIFNK